MPLLVCPQPPGSMWRGKTPVQHSSLICLPSNFLSTTQLKDHHSFLCQSAGWHRVTRVGWLRAGVEADEASTWGARPLLRPGQDPSSAWPVVDAAQQARQEVSPRPGSPWKESCSETPNGSPSGRSGVLDGGESVFLGAGAPSGLRLP